MVATQWVTPTLPNGDIGSRRTFDQTGAIYPVSVLR